MMAAPSPPASHRSPLFPVRPSLMLRPGILDTPCGPVRGTQVPASRPQTPVPKEPGQTDPSDPGPQVTSSHQGGCLAPLALCSAWNSGQFLQCTGDCTVPGHR